MAILLTGGVGFIGSHTAVACLNAGVDVVLADNFSNSSPKVLDRIEKITGKRPALYNVDVCDKRALRDIFAERSITGVIHFAGPGEPLGAFIAAYIAIEAGHLAASQRYRSCN